MPHLESVAKSLSANNAVALAVCTSDTREAFDKWMTENSSKYPHVKFVCDKRPRGSAEFAKRASAVYGVSGIPTQFVIGTDGKIVGSTVGYSEDGKALKGLLEKVNVKVGGE